MLEIQTMTEATLATLTPRSEKHGDDDVPAVSLALSMTVSNELLDTIDKDLAPRLFKHPGSKPLPGVRDALTVLGCNSIERVALTTKHEGWTLSVDDGADETLPLVFGGCKVDKLSVEPLQGGSVVLRMRVGTSDIDAEKMGMLGVHVGRSIWVTLIAPKPGEASDEKPAKAKKPDATDLFVASGTEAPANAQNDGAWPFPQGVDAGGAPPQELTETKTTKAERKRQDKAAAA